MSSNQDGRKLIRGCWFSGGFVLFRIDGKSERPHFVRRIFSTKTPMEDCTNGQERRTCHNSSYLLSFTRFPEQRNLNFLILNRMHSELGAS